MNIQVTQANLSKALSRVGRVAGGRTSLPVLSNVLLSTDGNQLKVAATNLEIALTHYIGAKVNEPGAITVPARLMTDFVSSLPDTNIELSVESNRLTLTTDNYTSTINGMSAEDFPSIPEVETDSPIIFTGDELKEAVQQVVVAASSDDSRPVLTGVYMYTDNKQLILVATDSYRLAERHMADVDDDFGLIIPSRTFAELQRIIEPNMQVEMHYDDTQVLVKLGETEVVSKLIDGKFPAYKQLIPEASEVSFTISKEQLLSITKVAALFARESAGSITLEVEDDSQEVSIASVASQVGKNTSKAKANVSGSGSVTLNSKFLIEALNVLDAAEVSFRFSGTTNPCILEPLGDNKDNYQHIIMPLKA